MKKIFLLVVALVLLAVPCVAEERAIYQNILLHFKDDRDDSKDQKVLKQLPQIIEKINQEAVLGDGYGMFEVITAPAILDSMYYKLKDFPKLQTYSDDVETLYKELQNIKRSESFSQRGLHAPEAKAWKEKVEKKRDEYKEAKLPWGIDDGFSDLLALAMQYSTLRVSTSWTISSLDNAEEIIFLSRNRIDKITNHLIIED